MTPLTVEPLEGAASPDAKPYVPWGALDDLFGCRDREVVCEGPADTGKSRACLEKLLVAMMKYPGARGGIFRKTRVSLTQTALKTWERHVLPAGAASFHHEDQEYRFANGSSVIVGGLDDPEKIKSLELDIAYVQEVSELEEEDWEILTTRVTGRSAVMPYQQLLADLNPVDPDFWLYQREEAGKVTFLHARHEDNPTITEARLAPLKALTGYRRDRLYLGLRVGAAGRYFEEWEPSRHVCAGVDIGADWTRWLAVDYGFAAPWCCLWLARDPDTRWIYVYRELYATGVRDEQQAELIAERCRGERIVRRVADPSMFAERKEQGKPSIASVYAAHGVPLERGTNQRRAGWNTVRRALAWQNVGADGAVTEHPPRLQVVRDACPNLIRTLPKMVRDPLDPEDLADTIKGVKTEDHAVDTLRYALMSEGAEARAPQGYGLSAGESRTPTPADRTRAWRGRGVDPFAKAG